MSVSRGHSLQPLVTCFDKYVLYETASFYYLIGCDSNETQYRILKLNRCVTKPKLLDDVLVEDPVVYGADELESLLDMINDGNKSTGGIKHVTVAYGLVGFVKFLDCYYFTLITQRKKVGCIGSNTIYAIKNTEIYGLRPDGNIGTDISFKSMWKKVNRKLSQSNTDTAESRYMGLFHFIDITKDFFFSYTYDLTHSLQHNFLMSSPDTFPVPPFKEMYEWNKYQTEDMKETLGDVNASFWTLPIIHGSFQQRRFTLFGRTVDLILMARRSRHYAGTRYLKRGVSVHGKVANDCEMEQIVQLDSGLQTSFASYVQMRGSIPTYWYQETSVTMPKPPILIDRVDSNFLATQSHFSDLIKRYSLPIIVLDLVKHHERRKRESIVGKEFRHATEIINISMPFKHQIRYIALDFSRISKSKGGSSKTKGAKVKSNNINATGMEWSKIESSLGKEVAGDKTNDSKMRSVSKRTNSMASIASSRRRDSDDMDDADIDDDDVPEEEDTSGISPPPAGRGDVLRELDDISSCTLLETSIFCSTIKHLNSLKEINDHHKRLARERGYVEQRGVLRTNCIDCLDRTNVAQFSMGVRFLTAALHSLGLLDSETLDPSNAMLLGLMDMFSDMGDRLALQYGGSEAHKKVSKGSGKTKQGELLTSIKRYYSNAFTDRVKQDAINLFLGYFQPCQHNYALWDLESDFFLHNKLLHPPRPEINRILYDTESAQRRIDPQEMQEFLEGLRKRKEDIFRKYLVRPREIANDKEASTTSNDDVANIEGEHWWQLVEEKEKMKFRLLETKVAMRAAEEWWWRVALHEFESERQWMRLPAPKDMIPSVPYFESVHNTSTLTFFDDELNTDFLRPIDATESCSLNGGKMASLDHYDDKESTEGGLDSDDEDIADLNVHKPAKRIDAEGFSLNSFFQRAKSIVGEILHPMSFEHPVNRMQGSEESKNLDSISNISGGNIESKWQTSNLHSGDEMTIYNKYTQIDDNSQRTYLRYCDDARCPETYIQEENLNSKYDFEKCLGVVSVDKDDVNGMIDLAANSHICDVIASGQYEGMQQGESALLATGLASSALVFVEPLLQVEEPGTPTSSKFEIFSSDLQKRSVAKVAPCLSSRSSSFSEHSSTLVTPSKVDFLMTPEERVPVLRKEQSLSKRRASAKYSVELSDKSRLKVEDIWHANTNFSQAGLEGEIQSSLNKYLYSQYIYGQEVDIERLAKRLSSLTNDKNIVTYMSMFTQDSVVMDIDTIKFIATDRATSYPLTALDACLSKLRPLKKKFDQKLKKTATKHSSDKQCVNNSKNALAVAKYGADLEEESEQKEFDLLRVSSKEYVGFTKIGPDLYSKISNPSFICNESAANFYTMYSNTLKELSSTTHH